MKKTSFIKNNNGVALIEFSVVLPFLLIMFLGMIELGNYTLYQQKLDKIASSMADFVTQGNTITTTNLNDFGLAVPHIMKPFAFDGTVIFSSASRASTQTVNCRANQACINWQHKILGSDNSKIGTIGSTPALPGGYTIPADQNIIVAEAYIHYKPILATSSNFIAAFEPQTLYKIAITKPRQGSLTTLGR